MVTLPKKPPRDNEHGGLDFDDGRTSGLERTIVWVMVVCSLLGAFGALSEVLQGLKLLGAW